MKYHEDSLLFLLRGNVEKVRAEDLAAWIAAHRQGVVIAPPAALAGATGEGEAALVARAEAEGRLITGFNYSNGDPVSLVVWSDQGHGGGE